MGRAYKTVAISYYPAQTSQYRWTDQDRGLMLAALKILAQFNGLATTLQVDEIDKLTNAFGRTAPFAFVLLCFCLLMFADVLLLPALPIALQFDATYATAATFNSARDRLLVRCSERGFAADSGHEHNNAACECGERLTRARAVGAHLARS